MQTNLRESFNKITLLHYFIISASLFTLSWNIQWLNILSLITFIPTFLLLMQFEAKKIPRWKVLMIIYSVLLFWNISTTWWIYNSTSFGAVFTFVANAFLMLIPFIVFIYFKKLILPTLQLLFFIFLYIGFEYWHLHWELSWPWLTLGNVFSTSPVYIQWYEYTGVLGGSLWVLLCNYFLYQIILNKKYIGAVLTLAFPFLFSIYLFIGQYAITTTANYEVIVVQPNIDPYTEKFPGSKNFIPYEEQINRLIQLSKKEITSKTKYVFWPETAVPANIDERMIEVHPAVQKLTTFAKTNNIHLVTGIDSYKLYDSKNKSATAQLSRFDQQTYYDTYNTALHITPKGVISTYHKSRLVPGVECLPYPKIFGILTDNLGAIVISVTKDTTAKVFNNIDNNGVAPIICYESVFGEYVSEFVKNDASFIAVITNDGWWGNTPGHIQHFNYARLRAIENRKSVVRAANTGLSGGIDAYGNVLYKNSYWKEDSKKINIRPNLNKTFYAMHGDYIGKYSYVVLGLLLIYGIIKKTR
jgi:apolipoprotein N-acyltransferase